MLIYFIPFISAFIGWFTNWIAIKMLFHPKEPKRFLFITFHGIFPKRQQQFAEKLGTTVANELLHFDEIATRIKDPQMLKDVNPYIEKAKNLYALRSYLELSIESRSQSSIQLNWERCGIPAAKIFSQELVEIINRSLQ